MGHLVPYLFERTRAVDANLGLYRCRHSRGELQGPARQSQTMVGAIWQPLRLGADDRDGLLGIEMGVYGAPETFLLNAKGEVVYKRVGDVNPRIWRDEPAPRLRQLGIVMNMDNTDTGAD